jgi:hypothetical protein
MKNFIAIRKTRGEAQVQEAQTKLANKVVGIPIT